MQCQQKDKNQPVKVKKEKKKVRKKKSCAKQLITEVQAGRIILQEKQEIIKSPLAHAKRKY